MLVQLVFSSCRCQNCPVVCPLVNCAGCAFRHFNQQWAQAKTLLPEFPAALNIFRFKTQNALAQTENVSYLVQKHPYTNSEKLVFSTCSCQNCPVVCPLVNCAGCAFRHFNQQWAQAKTLLPEFPAALNIFRFKTQNALAQTENVSYLVQKHPYTNSEKLVFSTCSCQNCPVVCPLVNCAGCAFRHFNQQWAQAKTLLPEFPAALNIFRFKTQNALAQTENVSYLVQKHPYTNSEKLVFSTCSCQNCPVVCPLVNCAGCAFRHFNQQWAQAKTLLPEFPAALNIFRFKTQNALAQTENVSYLVQKHPYTNSEKLVFSTCSCQNCPVVCPLVNCAGCAFRHFNQQWAQAKTLLPEFPAALNIFRFKTQNALAQTENVSYLVQKHPYTNSEKLVFSTCSCQNCPVVCPLVNCAGCAFRHFNLQWAQAKTLLPEFPAALNIFRFKTQNALAQTENVSYLVQKHPYTNSEKLVLSSCSCQNCPVVCPLVNCAGCALRHFNQQWAQAKTLLPEIPAALNIFRFKTQNALAQTENVSYPVQKHPYTNSEKLVFSTCSCQNCPVVCPLVNCAGCAFRHFNQQWAQAKTLLPEFPAALNIFRFKTQNALAQTENVSYLVQKHPYTNSEKLVFSSCSCKIVQLSVHLSTALVVRFGISISNGHKQRHSCQRFPRH